MKKRRERRLSLNTTALKRDKKAVISYFVKSKKVMNNAQETSNPLGFLPD